MALTWEEAARAKLAKSQVPFAHRIAKAAGGPIGCRIDDGNIIAVPGITEAALHEAVKKFPVAACDEVARTCAIRQIKVEAQRRICESGLGWMVERELSGGKPVPDEIKAYAAAVRAASDKLEADPPDDISLDRHWPALPQLGLR